MQRSADIFPGVMIGHALPEIVRVANVFSVRLRGALDHVDVMHGPASLKLRRASFAAEPVPASADFTPFQGMAVPSEAHGAKDGGGGGIRTPGGLASTSDFKSGALNHSATPPETGSNFARCPGLSSFLHGRWTAGSAGGCAGRRLSRGERDPQRSNRPAFAAAIFFHRAG
jgi:hypothetical protein